MAMRNKTIEERTISTPMRKLIKKLPGNCLINMICDFNRSLLNDSIDYALIFS